MKIIGEKEYSPLQEVDETRVRGQTKRIINVPSHPLLTKMNSYHQGGAKEW